MIGGTLMQTLILLYVTYRTDWDKEVMLHEIKLYHSVSWIWFKEFVQIIKVYYYCIIMIQVEKARKRLDLWDDKKEPLQN